MSDDDVRRALNNFAVCAGWTCILTNEQVDRLVDTVGSWIVCNGRQRDLVFRRITDNRVEVSTKEMIYK